ncbi:MAG TPA: hypothetical protein DF383_00200 [Deltaproteobacteria bacterium]|nr:hypothetical protein [Deltaproteobacteria bacterium]
MNQVPNIWVMDADGNQSKPLTHLKTKAMNTTFSQWSPDGTRITFSSDMNLTDPDPEATANPADNIWSIAADGSETNPVALTSLTTPDLNWSDFVIFSYSPDGTAIVFSSGRDLDPAVDGANTPPNNTQNIWIMDPNGNGEMPLTRLTEDQADNFVLYGND